jgi:hypothetical protein
MNRALADEHLQIIRSLMERSALYRRAVAPPLAVAGVAGILAAAGGLAAGVREPRPFVAWWLSVAVLSAGASLFVASRQAAHAREPFWSTPARRVALTLGPALALGALLGLAALPAGAPAAAVLNASPALVFLGLPAIWAGLYGCALFAASYLLPRGLQSLGLGLVAAAAVLAVDGFPAAVPGWVGGHCVMGLCFGVGHLACAAGMHAAERRAAVL